MSRGLANPAIIVADQPAPDAAQADRRRIAVQIRTRGVPMPHVDVPETRKLLLSVNDIATMEQSMFQWLQERGVAIIRASSTAKAMELLRRAQFDAVITNLRRVENGAAQKNNNAGIELTQQIRRVNAYIPIFIYTIKIDQKTRNSALKSGATMITTIESELKAGLKQHVF
jgi:response regulator RpfG family c-di-GMP phosphodiesterase